MKILQTIISYIFSLNKSKKITRKKQAKAKKNNTIQKRKKNTLGIDIFSDDPWLERQLKKCALQNVKSIVSLPANTLDEVAEIIENCLRQGIQYEDVANKIKNTLDITYEHALSIARNQTMMLNSSLTRLRQEELGITEYVFQSSGDERVRPSHAIMDGKTCKWSDPTVYKNKGKWVKRPPETCLSHPGTEENCRCIARPVLDELLSI
jgi:SPP1 gp7 family putative phage head morphogenesis protein